jgi:hypothetical protein
MVKYIAFTDLAAALDAESWEWLQETNPAIARALQAEFARGATADDVRRFVVRYGARPALVSRLRQAAAHLDREREQGGGRS